MKKKSSKDKERNPLAAARTSPWRSHDVERTPGLFCAAPSGQAGVCEQARAISEDVQIRAVLIVSRNDRPLAARRRVACALRVSEATVAGWEHDFIGAPFLQSPPWLLPEGQRADVARTRIRQRFGDLLTALQDGAAVETKAKRQRALNILQALLYALDGSSSGEQALKDLERRATRHLDGRTEISDGDDLPGDRVLVPQDHRDLKQHRNTLFGAKVALLAVIEGALKKHASEWLEPTVEGASTAEQSLGEHVAGPRPARGQEPPPPARRLVKADIDEIVNGGSTLHPAEPEDLAALTIGLAILAFVCEGALDSVLRRIEPGDLALVAGIVKRALVLHIVSANQVGRAVVYALGVPWNETKNFFAEATRGARDSQTNRIR